MPGPALGNAFVYGTLMAPEVTQALLSRVPAAKPARLEGFRRHALQGLVFPAIVPDPQGSVQGLVSAAGSMRAHAPHTGWRARGRASRARVHCACSLQVLMDLTEREQDILDSGCTARRRASNNMAALR